MRKFIECHNEGKKYFVNPDRVDGIIDGGVSRRIYVGGEDIAFEVDESVEELLRMIYGGDREPEEINIGDEVTLHGWLGRFIVITEQEDDVRVIGQDGSTLVVRKELCKKTGKRSELFASIAESLTVALEEWGRSINGTN